MSCSKGKPFNITRSAALIVALGSIKRGLSGPGSGRHDCEIILEFYDECLGKIGQTASSCDRYLKQKEECRNFKRDPNLRPLSEGLKKWQESEQRRATAAGFASMDEYHRHQESQDPGMCRIAYEFYKECISKGYTSQCDGYRKNCPQFK
ncbi:hypothetical protein ACB092_05G004300 [Castanea dentata]